MQFFAQKSHCPALVWLPLQIPEPPQLNKASRAIEEKHLWSKLVDKLLIYGSQQVHGVNQMGTNLSTSLNGKTSINALIAPIAGMLIKEAATAHIQLSPSRGFGARGEARARSTTLGLEDLNALVCSHHNWSAFRATMEDFGWTFEDVAVFDKLEQVARLALLTMQLFRGFSTSRRVKDDSSNPFQIVQRVRMQTAVRCILNLGGVGISAGYDDSPNSGDPYDPDSLLRITSLGKTLLLSDFEVRKVGFTRSARGGVEEKIAKKVRLLLKRLTKKHTFVDLVPLAARLCEMGRPVDAELKEAVTSDAEDATDLLEDWVVEALVERIIIESAEEQLSRERETRMGGWEDEKRRVVESIHDELNANTQLGTYNGGKTKIENYYLMRQLPKKPSNDAGRGGDTGGQVRGFYFDKWHPQWLTWSKEHQEEATGQRAEHHWQLAEYIVDNKLQNKYVRKLKTKRFWRE